MTREFGPRHYEIATNLHNIAAIAHHQGNAPKAEALYHRALDIKEHVLGTAHPDVALTLYNLAALYHDESNWDIAQDHCLRALSIFE